MSDLRNVSSNPHIRAKDTTSRIMLTVVIALLLPAFFGIYNFGFRALVLILISIFPQIADWLAAQLGIYSTVNMVFLIIIFALLLRVFLLTIKTSQLEHKLRVLVEELAIREKENAEGEKQDSEE